ncbi:MAG TPA: radical SAM protein, partial [Proteobacteria bacterium]|nr:radical SAM protein [Pseudomonadota bacterium]
MQVREAVIAVTYRCNSRCLHCSVWKMKPEGEVPPSFYARLPASLREVNISGGEPFLRDDLFEVCEVIHQRCRKPRMVINTNGLLPERTERVMRDLMRFFRVALRVSIDGLEETNDRIRGVEGHFRKGLETLERVGTLGLKDIGISFTLARGNEDELLDVYRLCRERGWDFTVTAVHSSPIYFGEASGVAPDARLASSALRRLAGELVRHPHPKRWFRARYALELARFIETGQRSFACGAAETFFFLDPFGVAYPCPILPTKLGDLHEASYEEYLLFAD